MAAEALGMLSIEERYEMALQKLREPTSSPSTLLLLCSDIFISRSDAIVSGWKQSGENIFDRFPDLLKNSLLQHLLSVHGARLKLPSIPLEAKSQDMKHQLIKDFVCLACMLMTEKTLNLDFKKIHWSSSTYSTTIWEKFREILLHAAAKCPQLERLAVTGHKKSYDRAKPAMFPESGLENLLKLQRLQHLDIFGVWSWSDDSLKQLFSHLKELVVLKLSIHPRVSVRGFENIHQLKLLEEFHFLVQSPSKEDGEIETSEVCSWIYGFLAENVNSLQLIGATVDDCYQDLMRFNFSLRVITPEIKGICPNLMHLHSNIKLPAAEFPNLKHLYFKGDPSISFNYDVFFQKFSTFTSLTTLSIGHLSPDVVFKMLEMVGTQLSSLSIRGGEGGDLFKMLHFCPNLVKFRLDCQSSSWLANLVVDDTSKYAALVTEHNFRLLEHFEADLDNRRDGLDRLFRLILLAPSMKFVCLIGNMITQAQCQILHHVEEGQLKKLRSLTLLFLKLDPSCSMDDVDLMVKHLVINSPCISNIQLDWSMSEDEDDWGKQSSAYSHLCHSLW